MKVLRKFRIFRSNLVNLKYSKAYPPTFAHHLATLSPDQQSYLLQQQKDLILRLSLLNNPIVSSDNNVINRMPVNKPPAANNLVSNSPIQPQPQPPQLQLPPHLLQAQVYLDGPLAQDNLKHYSYMPYQFRMILMFFKYWFQFIIYCFIAKKAAPDTYYFPPVYNRFSEDFMASALLDPSNENLKYL